MHQRSFISLLTILLLSTFSYSAFAQSVEQLQASANGINAKIQALDKEIAAYNTQIANTQGEAKTLKAALSSLELRRASLLKETERTNLRIREAGQNISKTESKITQTEQTISKSQQALAELLRNVASKQDSYSPIVSILSSNRNISDALDMIKRENDISKSIGVHVGDLRIAREDLTSTKAVYESTKATLEDLSVTLAGQKQLVEQTSKEKATLLTQTKNKESEYQKLLADRKLKKGQLEQEMLDVESKIKTSVDANKLPRYGKGVLKYPVNNVNITQYFGNTPFASQNPQVYNGGGHNGIDFAVKVGTPILSAEAGTVLGTGNTDLACNAVSYGKWVLIRHPNGLTTLYAHLSVISVSAGQTVTARQQIGLSGNTGYSTGPHLHFTVYASDSVHISGPTEYKSKVCGTYLIMPLAPRAGYLNPLSYL